MVNLLKRKHHIMGAFAVMSVFISLNVRADDQVFKDKIHKAFLSNPIVSTLMKLKGHKIIFDKSIFSTILKTTKFKHFLHGHEVIGSGVNFHIDLKNMSSLNIFLKKVRVPETPVYSAEYIREKAMTILDGDTIETITLKILPAHGGQPDRLIYELIPNQGGILWYDAINAKHIATMKEDMNIDTLRWQTFSASQLGIISTRIPGKNVSDQPCTISDIFGSKTKNYNMIECLQKTQNACQVLNWDKSPILMNPTLCKSHLAKDESAARAEANSENSWIILPLLMVTIATTEKVPQ
jgi:hypothetical protein